MARIRSLKPDFFDDEDLAELPFWARILFEGLWCHADREGRLEDRPLKLKAKIFPYDKVNVEKGIDLLAEPKKHSPSHKPFIVRYSVNGENYIQVVEFLKHQSPHHTEKESDIPPPNGDLTVKEPLDKSQRGDGHYPKPENLNPKSKNKKAKSTFVTEIVSYLNEKTGKNFSCESKETKGLINGRLAEGRTVADFKRVIDIKVAKWLNDPKMSDYLRPSTLFRPGNFESYLNELKPEELEAKRKKEFYEAADKAGLDDK